MSVKSTLFLLAAVILFALYIQFGERTRETLDERKAAARMAFRFDPEVVRSLRIETPSGVYVLELTNTNWRIASPVQAPADASTILRMLDTLSSVRKSEVITAEEQQSLQIDPAQYGFFSPRAQLSVDDGIAPFTVLIGRDAPGGKSMYLKRADMPDIIVANRDLLSVLPASVLDLRDRRLFSGQPGRVRRLEWTTRDQAFHASRNAEDQWNMDRPVQARASGSAIRQWLERIFEFRVLDFVAESVAAGSLYGFDEPAVQLAIFMESRPAPSVLKIGRAADAGETTYFASLVGQDTVFTVERAILDALKIDSFELRDRQVVPIPAMNIQFIQISDGQRLLQLVRNTQSVWEVTSPKRFVAHDQHVQRLLGAWTGAKVHRFLDPPAFNPGNAGATGATYSIRFARQMPASDLGALAAPTNNGARPPMDGDVTYMIGPTNESGQLVIFPIQPAYAIEVSPLLAETLSTNPLDYRDPLVLAINPSSVRRIVQRLGEMESGVESTNSLFRGRSPSEIPDTAAIDGLLGAVNRLLAVRFIVEDAADLSPFGLDLPRRQLILGVSGDLGINRVLLFGHDTGDGETYAMVQGSDVVFTLAETTVATLLKPVANSIVPATAVPTLENP